MLWTQGCTVNFPFALRPMQGYIEPSLAEGVSVMLSLVLAYLSRRGGFVWRPDLDLSDRAVYSALLPNTQY